MCFSYPREFVFMIKFSIPKRFIYKARAPGNQIVNFNNNGHMVKHGRDIEFASAEIYLW